MRSAAIVAIVVILAANVSIAMDVTMNLAFNITDKDNIIHVNGMDYNASAGSIDPPGWTRKRSITINNQGPALVDYPFRIVVEHDSDMQNDFDDLRFYDNTNSLLKYWMQNFTAGGNATVWINVSLPTGNTTIYMYYGNSSVASISNLSGVWGSGVTAFWPFDENSTANGGVKDRAQLGINGTAINNVYFNTSGRFGQSWSFDGVNDYINLGSDSNLIQPVFSIYLWFNTAGCNSMSFTFNFDGCVLYRWRTYGFFVNIGNATSTYHNRIRFGFINSTASYFYIDSSSTYNDSQWHQVVGTYNGTFLRLYIDGVEVNSTSAGSIFYGTGGAAIGRDGDANVGYFNGTIDNVILYNRPLSTSEIKYAASEPIANIGAEGNTSSELLAATFTDPEKKYISAEKGGALAAIAFAGREFISVGFDTGYSSSAYLLRMTQDEEKNRFLIVFTNGTWQNVEKIADEAARGMIGKTIGSVAAAVKQSYPIFFRLEYDFDISGKIRVSSATKLLIKNTGSRTNPNVTVSVQTS